MINRRAFLAASSLGPASPAAPSRRPNFIVFLADDMGYEDLSCTGSTYIRTPHIDALAAGGTRFTGWYSCAPVCAPSRGSLLTGRYPQRNGVVNNGISLPSSELTIAEVLRPAGYRTALVGKWHLGTAPEHVPNARGFDYFYGFHNGCIDFFSHRFYWGEPNRVNYHDLWRNREEIFEDGIYSTDLFAREAVRFVGAPDDRPFFLYCAFNAPHYPMHAPGNYLQRFASLPLEQRVRAAMISALDDAVGDVVGALRRNGRLDNTFIFFSSDNGATREPRGGLDQKPPIAGSNKSWRGFKFSLFDGGTHVPAILHWPGRVAAGQVRAGLAAHMDLLPTFCSAAGLPVPADRIIDGVNVLQSPHDEIYWESGKQRAVRRGPWKLVLDGADFDYSSGKGYVPLPAPDNIFLSNLEDDPGEFRNLAASKPELAAGLRRAVDSWRSSVAAR